MSSNDVEASYGLSPSQMGMLFHRLTAPRAAKDLLQVTCRWSEPVEPPTLRKSWQLVTARHATLRLAFRWEGLAEPVQDIYRQVDVPFDEEDCRHLPPALESRRLEEYLESDRRQGFLAGQPPLFRLKLFQWTNAAYTLVWTVHHAVVDGRSITLVLKEVFEYYEALKRGEEPLLPVPPRPYRDYVDWCLRYNPPEAEAFWRTLLGGFTAPTALPIARPAAPDDALAANYGEQEVLIPGDSTDALRTLASRSNATLNTVVQAAWAVLLSRYSGEEDVVFGATRACRHSSIEGAADIIGTMVNTLPVRARINPDASVASLLRELREQHLRVRDYEQIPLTKVQGWSDLPGGVAPFESAIVFHNYPYDGTFRYKPGIWPNCDFHFYLNLIFTANVMVYNEPGLRIKIIHDRSRLDDGAVERTLGHLRTLLEGIATDPDRPIRELPLLTEAERRRMLVEWNDTTTPYPRDLCLQELFEQQAARSPDAVAIMDGERQLTYRELNRLANQVANYLRSVGVRRGDRVGVYMPRCLEMMIGLLGIIKAGAAYLPLDADYPQARLSFMLEDSKVSVTLTLAKFAGALAGFNGRAVPLDSGCEALWQSSEDNPPLSATAEDLAYVIYTSGSTGIPKGVAIPQRAVSRLLFNTNYVRLTSADRIAQMSNASFDAATFEIWGALLFGGRLVIVPKEVALSPKALALSLRKSGVTTLFVTTLLFNHIAMEEPGAFRTLKQVLFGGEAVDPHWVREILSKGKPQRLLHVYGPTETTTFALWHLVDEADEDAKTIPIGKPISNTRAYVLDRALQPVSVGIPGQLCLSGDGLARGYENRPEVTAEKFVPSPFGTTPRGDSGDTRIYLTGDLVRRLPDGNIEFLGRLDRQIKIRGFRVELGEIEAVLRRHEAVRECAVILREDTPGDKRLVAYVVSGDSTPLNITELRRFLQAELPEYMIPAAFVSLALLPLSPTGKVDSSALPVPDRSRPALEDKFAPPQTPTERALAAVWADVLGLERVGIQDNFFDLGGDSILSIQVVSRAARAGLKLTPRQIFQHQTIARLTADLASVKTAAAEQGAIAGPVPLTPIQSWFFERKLPVPHHFNQSVLLQLRSDLSHTLLARAVESVIVHHDALRMRYARTESSWSQWNAGVDGLPQLEVTDFSRLPEANRLAAFTAKVAELQASLDLAHGPLARFHLFQAGAREPDRLFVTVHHLVVDGVSWRILLEDLDTAYSQLSDRKKIRLPAKTTSFKGWAGQLLEYAESQPLEKELDYWLGHAPHEPFLLPCDHPSQANRSTAGSIRSITVSLPSETTRALLQEVPAAYQTRINDVLLAALAQVISKWAGSREVWIDLEGHGREEVLEGFDVSRTIGWFTAMFPLSLHLDGGASAGQALKSVKEQLRRIPNNGIGYGVLQYMSRNPDIAARLRALPKRQLCFNYLGQFDQAITGSSLFEPLAPQLELSQDPNGHTDHILNINASIVRGRLTVAWSYSQNLYRPATIQMLADAYAEALQVLIAHCQSFAAGGFTPSDFPESGLNQEELDALLGELGNV